MTQVALVTGFEAYGGRSRNPAGEIAAALDGSVIGGAKVVGRCLPVAFGPLDAMIPALFAELDPVAVICLGLCPGEPVIRLERVGINLADFDIPDNEGAVLVDQQLDPQGTAARFATLPLRQIQSSLLAAGIPARQSSTAGTYLCNHTLYRFLGAIEGGGAAVPCGFIHLPYMAEQVAAVIARMLAERSIEGRQRSDLPSMSLTTMSEAVRIALDVTLTDGRSASEAVVAR
ncbi:MAG: hypothetical protein AAF637_05765 [Pseudomonadota bacterium]